MEHIDLHLHSNFSDGTMSPSELVHEALKEQIKGISITDHDTIEGVSEALEEGKRVGVEVLSGVEISAYLDDIPMHILGYGFDLQNRALRDGLKKIQKARDERNWAILEKLNALGINVTKNDLQKHSPTGQTGRPHIASLLIEKKVVKNMDEAFARYLRKNTLAYSSRQKLLCEDAIKMINDAGGLAVLAHPLTIDRSMASLPQVLKKLKEKGLKGVEAYYPIHSVTNRQKLIAISRELNLLITGGSDFHGSIRNGTRLGGINKKQRVPYELLETLKKHLNTPAS